MRRPVSGRAGPTELPAKRGFSYFFSFFPKRRAWNEADLLGNESMLSPSPGTCCILSARVTVSDTSCHLQCSSLVPESVLTSCPSRGPCTVWRRRGNNSKANLKHPTWVRKKRSQTNNPTLGSWLRNILDLIPAHQGWQKSLLSSHVGNEFFMCVWEREREREKVQSISVLSFLFFLFEALIHPPLPCSLIQNTS